MGATPFIQSRGPHAFSVKDQIANILDFEGHLHPCHMFPSPSSPFSCNPLKPLLVPGCIKTGPGLDLAHRLSFANCWFRGWREETGVYGITGVPRHSTPDHKYSPAHPHMALHCLFLGRLRRVVPRAPRVCGRFDHTFSVFSVSQDQRLLRTRCLGTHLGSAFQHQHHPLDSKVSLLIPLLAHFLNPAGPVCASASGLTVPSSLPEDESH